MGCAACSAKYKRLHQSFAKKVELQELSLEQKNAILQERLRRRANRGVVRKPKSEEPK